jgi:TetR/AcrR family transcriptional regulator
MLALEGGGSKTDTIKAIEIHRLYIHLIIDTLSLEGYRPTMNYIAERRLEEKERRRAEILDATEAVAASVGWDAMTMDQVARKARLSRALVYVYFKDKTDLMFGIGERALATLHQCFADAVAKHATGLEQLGAIGHAYIAYSRDHAVYFDVMARCELISTDMANLQPNEQACLLGGDAVRQLMQSALELGVRDGSIRADVGEAKAVTVCLWGFIHGVIQLSSAKAKMLAHDGLHPRELLEQAMLMATRSLMQPG